MIRVHLAYSHPVVREAIANSLAREPGLSVVGRGRSGESGLEDFAGPPPDVVVVEQPFFDDTRECVTRYRAASGGAKIVLLCGAGRREVCVASGADAVVEPASGTEAIAAAVRASAG